MAARRGDTLLFPTPPVVAAHAAIGGKKEGEGPLAACFDELSADNFFGQSNWEAAEKEMTLRAARLCLKKAETTPDTSASRWRATYRPSVPRPATPCGSWASPLRASSGPAARWPKRWASARRCAVQAWPTACWR